MIFIFSSAAGAESSDSVTAALSSLLSCTETEDDGVFSHPVKGTASTERANRPEISFIIYVLFIVPSFQKCIYLR